MAPRETQEEGESSRGREHVIGMQEEGESSRGREHVIGMQEEGESSRGGEHGTEIDEEESTDPVVLSLKRELPQVLEHKQPQHKSGTICKVRSILRNGNEATYTPKLVSIGPYHHEELKDTQEVKLKYLSDLIQRSPRNSVENYVKVVKAHAKEAMKQYCEGVHDASHSKKPARDIHQYDLEGFVKMMVVDGCFIIEFLVKWYLNDKMGQMNTVKTKLPLLRNDLLLVENQIPFNILEALFEESRFPMFNSMIKKNKDDPPITITELALFYFFDDRVCAQWMAENFSSKSFHHLLHLYHSSLDPFNHRNMHLIVRHANMKTLIISSTLIKSCMLKCLWLRDHLHVICCAPLHWLIGKFWGWIKKIIGFPFNLMSWRTSTIGAACTTIFQLITMSRHRHRRDQRLILGIPNATHLRDTGFKFKKKTGTLCFLDVSHQGRTIHIPVLSIDDTTLIHFQNLIAFEDTSLEYGYLFTPFAKLMYSLIDTAEDVTILKECGIIEHRLGDDEKVADFFNNLHRGSYIDNEDDHYLRPLFRFVTKYYTRTSYRIRFYWWRKKFVPDYFSNPWAVPSMIAAFILLVLTVAQTFYTIYPYYHPRSNS